MGLRPIETPTDLASPSALTARKIGQMTGEPERENFLERIGSWLGAPGYAVRNILQAPAEGPGKVVDAIENVADFVTGTFTVYPITGYNPFRLATDRAERPEFSELLESYGVDAPDPGIGRVALDIVGGIATDPLSYISAGGVGAARGVVQGVSQARRARALVPLITKTKAGKAAMQAAKGTEVAEQAAKIAARAPDWIRKSGMKADELEDVLAARKILGETPGATIEEQLTELGRRGLIEYGGLRFAPMGITRFQKGGAIGAGRNYLSLAGQYGTAPGLAWKAFRRLAPESADIIGGKAKSLWEATARAFGGKLVGRHPHVRDAFQRFKGTQNRLRNQWMQTFERSIGQLTDEQAVALGKELIKGGNPEEVVARVGPKTDEEAQLMLAAARDWRESMADVWQQKKQLGMFADQDVAPEYMPHQYTQALEDLVTKTLEEDPEKYDQLMAQVENVFNLKRTLTLEEFELHAVQRLSSLLGREVAPEEAINYDIKDLFQRVWRAHAAELSGKRFMQSMKEFEPQLAQYARGEPVTPVDDLDQLLRQIDDAPPEPPTPPPAAGPEPPTPPPDVGPAPWLARGIPRGVGPTEARPAAGGAPLLLAPGVPRGEVPPWLGGRPSPVQIDIPASVAPEGAVASPPSGVALPGGVPSYAPWLRGPEQVGVPSAVPEGAAMRPAVEPTTSGIPTGVPPDVVPTPVLSTAGEIERAFNDAIGRAMAAGDPQAADEAMTEALRVIDKADDAGYEFTDELMEEYDQVSEDIFERQPGDQLEELEAAAETVAPLPDTPVRTISSQMASRLDDATEDDLVKGFGAAMAKIDEMVEAEDVIPALAAARAIAMQADEIGSQYAIGMAEDIAEIERAIGVSVPVEWEIPGAPGEATLEPGQMAIGDIPEPEDVAAIQGQLSRLDELVSQYRAGQKGRKNPAKRPAMELLESIKARLRALDADEEILRHVRALRNNIRKGDRSRIKPDAVRRILEQFEGVSPGTELEAGELGRAGIRKIRESVTEEGHPVVHSYLRGPLRPVKGLAKRREVKPLGPRPAMGSAKRLLSSVEDIEEAGRAPVGAGALPPEGISPLPEGISPPSHQLMGPTITPPSHQLMGPTITPPSHQLMGPTMPSPIRQMIRPTMGGRRGRPATDVRIEEVIVTPYEAPEAAALVDEWNEAARSKVPPPEGPPPPDAPAGAPGTPPPPRNRIEFDAPEIEREAMELLRHLTPRKGIQKALETYQRYLRAGITVGTLGIPWPAFHVRNAISAIFQSMLDPDIGPVNALRTTMHIVGDLVSAKAGGMKTSHMAMTHHALPALYLQKRPNMARKLEELTKLGGKDSVRAWKGYIRELRRAEGAIQALDQLPDVGYYTAREAADLALDFNVLHKFIDSELITKELGEIAADYPEVVKRLMAVRPGKDMVEFIERHPRLRHRLERFNALLQGDGLPKAIAAKIENMHRLGAFFRLLRQNVEPGEAAARVKRAFVDYEYASHAERWVRDLFPFSKFTIGTVPVVAQESLRRPGMILPFTKTARSGEAEGDVNEQKPWVTPRWLRESVSIPLGEGEDLQRMYLTRLGTVQEELNQLGTGEGVGRTFEKGVLARLTPAIRAPVEASTGRSFFTGEDMADFRFFPKVSPATEVAITASPFSRVAFTIRKLLDQRKPVWARAINVLTGATIATVEEDRALRNLLRDYFEREAAEGNLKTFTRFYQQGEIDPKLEALLKRYYGRE